MPVVDLVMMKRLWWIVGAAGGILVAGTVVTIMFVLPREPIPNSIREQLTSPLLLPRAAQANIDRSSVKYNSDDKLLTYRVTYRGSLLLVSEQPTPEQLVDIPAAYDKVVENMNQYSSFVVSAGTVHLTRPKDAGGVQVAVMNAKGTLMFVKSDRDLSNDDWRRLFVSFE